MKNDMQLRKDVEQELESDPSITRQVSGSKYGGRSTGVEVRDRIVTLAGHLGSFAEKLAARHAAQRHRLPVDRRVAIADEIVRLRLPCAAGTL
ncbi:BON domain-containing protein [Paraburkholderia caribensis]|uniref:hypothetical protein n=1 Tax=Paraburkholderia caribensis TaxID=75105 RepID=UPI001591E266|nr:hypothetical protein [Paraburkholderia caribensis]